jgi:hypothetical protein
MSIIHRVADYLSRKPPSGVVIVCQVEMVGGVPHLYCPTCGRRLPVGFDGRGEICTKCARCNPPQDREHTTTCFYVETK